MTRVSFELPLVVLVGIPALAAVLLLQARRLALDGLGAARASALLGLRGLALAVVLALLARPVAQSPGATQGGRRVVVLLDHSRSMGLVEGGSSRYRSAVTWAQGLPKALAGQGLQVETWAFDAAASPTSLEDAARAEPNGAVTDLGAAIVQGSGDPAPVAVLALTDGAANRNASNQAALLALLEDRTPFVGIGFGRDLGLPSLSLHRVSAPSHVPPRQSFRVTAQLVAAGGPAPDFDLLLLRDGALVQSRRVVEGRSSPRVWTEGFEVTESEDGLHEYTIQARLPPGAPVVTVATQGSVPVRIGKEKDFRILFVQGALTWDFKFVSRALRGDPTLRLTGLSRTSKQSVFRQNVEAAGELLGGFPQDIKEMAPFRVLVLSELRPADLSAAQQELVARFCGELGGGVLMVGGSSTFDQTWQGTRLEQLLPVTLDGGGVAGLDAPFHLQLTEDAKRNPVFQVRDDGSSARVFDSLPTFTGYGRVLREKPGAVVWARHDQDASPHGRRVLMASQAYGAGVSAIIAVQSVWRWRLAKDADPQTFDRFWRQLFHHLGQSRPEFQFQILDQELRTHADVRALVERLPRPEEAGARDAMHLVRVRSPRKELLVDQRSHMVPGRPVEIRFRTENPGVYTLTVENAGGTVLASQPLEILDLDREMERTGRDMENLRQWAAATGGFALASEEADPQAVATRLKTHVDQALRARRRPRPVGINGGILALLLACLGGEWLLRRAWDLS